MASYQLGIIVDKLLEPNFPFFLTPNAEYIPIFIIFVAFLVLFYMVKDYFIICCTGLIGAFMMILGISYAGYFDFDFLLSLEIGKWSEIDKLVT